MISYTKDELKKALINIRNQGFISCARVGKSIGQLQAIYREFEMHSVEELNLLPLSSFSSPSAKGQFIKNIIALNACYR